MPNGWLGNSTIIDGRDGLIVYDTGICTEAGDFIRRLYGPTEPRFDLSWELPQIARVDFADYTRRRRPRVMADDGARRTA